MGFPGGSAVKNLPINAGDTDSIPGSGRSPGERGWQLTPVFLPGNPVDRVSWRATVLGIAKSQIWLSTAQRIHVNLICQFIPLSASLLCPRIHYLLPCLYSYPGTRVIFHFSWFHMHILIYNKLFYSFWVTSLCMTNSRSNHISTNDPISFQFFLWLSNIPLYKMFRSVTQSYPTLCDPMDCSMPGLPVDHQPPEFTQTHVHQVGDAIQPSHPLLSPSPAFSLSQHQGLFKQVSSLHQVAKVLELQLQHQSFQWIFRTLKNLQHHSSKAPILQHSSFFMVQLSHPYMTTRKTITLTR